MQVSRCPFCQLSPERILSRTTQTIVLRDRFPVNRGHTLVIPTVHVSSLYELSGCVQAELWAMAAEVRQRLLAELEPDGFNIGVNDGAAAGQTVGHAHIHIIPRWKGDVDDPRGGIRWVVPDQAEYW